VLKDIPRDNSEIGWARGGKKARTRTVGEDRQRILNDVSENL
jgi:hypothetical protein